MLQDAIERPSFQQALKNLLNTYSKENENNTPDYVLAEYLESCLDNYNATIKKRNEWFNSFNKNNG